MHIRFVTNASELDKACSTTLTKKPVTFEVILKRSFTSIK